MFGHKRDRSDLPCDDGSMATSTGSGNDDASADDSAVEPAETVRAWLADRIRDRVIGPDATERTDALFDAPGPRRFDESAPIRRVHADAAMAGSAMLLPEYRHLFSGIEDADSISWNPHKWMGTILDTSLLYLRDPEHLIRVMSTNPSYLQSTAGGEATQYRDWGIPLGRRFRALKLWYQLRIDGPDAIAERLRR
ncbi:MAG: hypothetical protein EBY65_10050, partial [Acidimicrobiia bacterium]|nr:hypothetical protein [Acidimicrobiia bacterium]